MTDPHVCARARGLKRAALATRLACATTLALAATLLAGCANHPIDCAIGFYHADCLPGTAGYSDPNKFAAEDDKNCRSYGLAFGSPEYAACRLQFTQQHRSPEIGVGVGYSVTTVNHR